MGRHHGKENNSSGGGTDTLYRPEYCELLMEHMSKGFSFTSFGGEIGRGRTTLFEWLDEHPEFRRAKDVGHEKAKKFFEAMAIGKMDGSIAKGDTPLLTLFLRTRFRDEYTDRVEIANADDTSLKVAYTLDQNAT